MAYRYIIILYLLSLVNANATNAPKVYEEINEDVDQETNIRVARHPKFRQKNEPPIFDYKRLTQQDPQKMRYAQQQKVDSYVRAYQHEQNIRQYPKSRKAAKQQDAPNQAKTAYDTRPKSENVRQSLRQTNLNFFPVEADIGVSDQYAQKKVVDPKTGQRSSNKFPNSDNSQQDRLNVNNQKLSTVQTEKVIQSKPLGYQVLEENMDQDTQSSNQREARLYIGQEEIIKSTLSPNYLAKPTYVLANPQLNLDPKLFLPGVSYALPENHQLAAAGFQPATKTDIEALSSLLGKAPNAQLQGLNELLGQHAIYPVPVQAPEIQQVAVKQVTVTPEALIGVNLQDHTPIKEESPDIINLQAKPNIQVNLPQTQVDYNSHTSINHEVKFVPEVKTIYKENDDNLQYAAKYAFGYKIRDFHSGSNFGHEEIREGDTAKGHYHVLLPDGRLQNVEYWADPSGYHAKVTYTNVAHH